MLLNYFHKNLFYLSGVFLTLFFAFSLTVSAQSCSVSGQLAEQLQNLDNISGSFVQTIYSPKREIIQQTKGSMALKRPGLFRWETAAPNQQLIIADGKYIWIYDKDLKQISRQKQTASSNTPGLLLSDSVRRLITQFTIKTPPGNTNIFTLIPKNPQQSRLFKSVVLIFNQHELKQMILYDNLSQTTEISFTQIAPLSETYHTKKSKDLFVFIPPKDIDIVDSV